MRLSAVTASLFQDIAYYLEALAPDEYTHPLELLSQASLGQHTRHMLEFYQCLVEQAPAGVIDYDARVRNHAIEQDPQYARAVMHSIQQRMAALDVELPLRLKADFGQASSGPQSLVFTTYGRELVYNIEHSIHHLAIVRIGLRYLRPDLVLPKGFGVAPSTLKHWEQQEGRVES